MVAITPLRLDLVPYVRGDFFQVSYGGFDARIFPTAKQVSAGTPEVDGLPDGCADTVYCASWPQGLGAWRLLRQGGHLAIHLSSEISPADIAQWLTQTLPEGWDMVALTSSGLLVLRKTENGRAFSHKTPRPTRSIGIVSVGGFGDALWITAMLAAAKKDYEVTVYTSTQGEEVLRHNPNIDHLICTPKSLFGAEDYGHEIAWFRAFWLYEEAKHDKFINLTGAMNNLLPWSADDAFWLPFEQRTLLMSQNYVAALHQWGGMPLVRGPIKFYPTAEERQWALETYQAIGGPLVLIQPGGSSAPKWWPHAQLMADTLAEQDITSWIVGDLRGNTFLESEFVKVVGQDLSIRKLFALAQQCDAVVGVESALVNAVAYESKVLKVALLSHSTHENLTRDWVNAVSVAPVGVGCYPCHRNLNNLDMCMIDELSGAAACQAREHPSSLVKLITERLKHSQAQAA